MPCLRLIEMFGQFTYLASTLIFTLPLILYLWWRHGTQLWNARGLIAVATALVTAFGFLVWPYGLAWKCWAYSSDKILGLTILGTVFEDVVWWLCISFLFACTVTLLAGFEDEGKPFMAILLGRSGDHQKAKVTHADSSLGPPQTSITDD